MRRDIVIIILGDTFAFAKVLVRIVQAFKWLVPKVKDPLAICVAASGTSIPWTCN